MLHHILFDAGGQQSKMITLIGKCSTAYVYTDLWLSRSASEDLMDSLNTILIRSGRCSPE